MPNPTNTQRIDSLRELVSKHEQILDFLKDSESKNEAQIRKIALMEEQIQQLRKTNDDAQKTNAIHQSESNTMRQDLGRLQAVVELQQKQIDKWDNRIWAFIGALLMIASGLIATLSGLRKTP